MGCLGNRQKRDISRQPDSLTEQTTFSPAKQKQMKSEDPRKDGSVGPLSIQIQPRVTNKPQEYSLQQYNIKVTDCDNQVLTVNCYDYEVFQNNNSTVMAGAQ